MAQGMSFRIETERLLLQKLTLDDAALMLAIWNDPAFHRFVGDRGIRTLDQARDALSAGALAHYADYGFGPYRVSLKTGDTPVGICGLFRREGLDDTDIGFSILPLFSGNGLAFEAARAVISHAREEIRLGRLTALVAPENHASIRLIEKLGLVFETMICIPGEGEEVCRYAVALAD